ncbi:DNA cytosine methyltransferase [Parasedimentitalea psychrophila]|uniref:DNA (cytosine-5-)-methyltransferase n=1 Tax=Parasedimentitalea psychrophila TaxID=2997337 RepID=A0A9Y2P789_9RHOB|nr:DNA cytosine methyltransferase [Parasedimentitalea psychrophila]WIY25788.1 DNA cytosine methyltransferase [Parasedimentitalea psychrophila]
MAPALGLKWLWVAALALHQANHPDTIHLDSNIWEVEPDVILMENVEEFKTWGPVDEDGQPIKEFADLTFELWMTRLKKAGYKKKWGELRACDFGDPTIRKRFFMVARRDGRPIVWPKPSHGDPYVVGLPGGQTTAPSVRRFNTGATGSQQGVIAPWFAKYYGTGDGARSGGPLHTVTVKDRVGHMQAELAVPEFSTEHHQRARQVAEFLRSQASGTEADLSLSPSRPPNTWWSISVCGC